MKNKYSIPLLIITILLFAALLIMAFITRLNNYENILLVSQKPYTEMGANLEKIDEIKEEDFLITFEVNKERLVKAASSNYNVILKGTNHSYANVMDYKILNGSFFTKAAYERKQRNVVLNESAAFEMFGSFNIVGNEIIINNQKYTITGVMNDKDDENMNVYIPISFIEKQPDSFLVGIDSDSGVTEEYVRNELKQGDITDLNYDFINIDVLSHKVQEETTIALLFVVCVILAFIIRESLKKITYYGIIIRELLKQYYFIELLKKKPEDLFRIIMSILSIIFCLIAFGVIGINMVGIFLNWSEYTNIFNSPNFTNFHYEFGFLQDILMYSSILFYCFIIALILCAASMWQNGLKII